MADLIGCTKVIPTPLKSSVVRFNNRSCHRPSAPSPKMPCFEYFNGFCPYGDSCWFSHEADTIPATIPHTAPTTPIYPVNPMSPFQTVPLEHRYTTGSSSSRSTSPSNRSAAVSGQDSDTNRYSQPRRSSQPNPHVDGYDRKKSLSKKRKPQRFRYGEGSAEMFAYWQQQHYLHAQQFFVPFQSPMTPYFPSDAVKEAHGQLRIAEVQSPTSPHIPTELEKIILKANAHREASVTSSDESSIMSVSPSNSTFPLPSFTDSGIDISSYSRLPDEIIDFESDDELMGNGPAVDADGHVETFQCSKVGVLGGGVMLGSAKRRSRPGVEMYEGNKSHNSRDSLDVLTKEDIWESDEECTVPLIPQTPVIEVQSAAMEPALIPLPEGDDSDLIEDHQTATTPKSHVSWADIDEDDSFLDGPLPQFTPKHKPVELPIAPTATRPIVKPTAPRNAWTRSNRPVALTLTQPNHITKPVILINSSPVAPEAAPKTWSSVVASNPQGKLINSVLIKSHSPKKPVRTYTKPAVTSVRRGVPL